MKRIVVASALFVCGIASAAPTTQPNIIVIVADDLGYADLGCQGSSQAKTPNIDTLAANGARFTDAYVSCPVCSPTRAGILTGRYQQRFGHEFNPGPNAPKNFGLPLDQITIADVMKQAGYATGMVGKWHEGNQPEFRRQKRGFDEFYGFLGGAHPYLRWQGVLDGNEPAQPEDYLTDSFAHRAVSF